MAELDLDAVKAAKSEATKEPHRLKLRDVHFELPGACPGLLFDVMLEGQLAETQAEQIRLGVELFHRIKKIVGPEKWEALLDAGFDADDFEVLFQGVAKVYGFTVGESRASRGSSPNGGRRARPTSNGSTRSTSRKPSSAKTVSPPAGSSR